MMSFKTTNADSLIKRPTFSCHKLPTFFLLYKFYLGFYILHFLRIHCWFNITNIILYSPDDGSLEPKRFSVDLASQWISLSTWINLLSISLYKLLDYNPLFTSISKLFTYIKYVIILQLIHNTVNKL